MAKFFTSDWHLSHTKIIQLSQRPFRTVSEMDDTIINNALKVIHNGDEFFFLGDLSWNYETPFKFFQQLPYNVKFHWILGNHEKGWERYKKYCYSISRMEETTINGNSVTLCHYPMLTWNKSHYNSWQLFGHHHISSNGNNEINKLTTGKMLNVNVEFHNYEPWSEFEIEEYMSRRSDNWDLIKRE